MPEVVAEVVPSSKKKDQNQCGKRHFAFSLGFPDFWRPNHVVSRPTEGVSRKKHVFSRPRGGLNQGKTPRGVGRWL